MSTEVIIDAKGRSLGRVASEAALLLRGKKSPDFERHTAPKQTVIIKNASKVRVTGKKMTERTTERYSGYPGGLKKIPYSKVFDKDPSALVRNAITGMIPRTRLRKNILKNLTIYGGEEK